MCHQANIPGNEIPRYRTDVAVIKIDPTAMCRTGPSSHIFLISRSASKIIWIITEFLGVKQMWLFLLPCGHNLSDQQICVQNYFSVPEQLFWFGLPGSYVIYMSHVRTLNCSKHIRNILQRLTLGLDGSQSASSGNRITSPRFLAKALETYMIRVRSPSTIWKVSVVWNLNWSIDGTWSCPILPGCHCSSPSIMSSRNRTVSLSNLYQCVSGTSVVSINGIAGYGNFVTVYSIVETGFVYWEDIYWKVLTCSSILSRQLLMFVWAIFNPLPVVEKLQVGF